LVERIAAQAAAGGSALTLQDLAEHTSEWVTPQAHLQMIVRIFDYGLNPQTASDAPRWYVAEDFRLALESGLPDNVAAELAERGHRLMPDPPTRLFGGAQLTACLPDGYCGASDHRKDGQAVGF
jgi:gamma-glutamyltranspeptidase/glutathione hydrolase